MEDRKDNSPQLHRIGDYVWAKAAGYPWWPGKVVGSAPKDVTDEQPEEYKLMYLIKFIHGEPQSDEDSEYAYLDADSVRHFSTDPERNRERTRIKAIERTKELQRSSQGLKGDHNRTEGVQLPNSVLKNLHVPVMCTDYQIAVIGGIELDDSKFQLAPDVLITKEYYACNIQGELVVIGDFVLITDSTMCLRVDRVFEYRGIAHVYGPVVDIKEPILWPVGQIIELTKLQIPTSSELELVDEMLSKVGEDKFPPLPFVDREDEIAQSMLASPLDVAKANSVLKYGTKVALQPSQISQQEVDARQLEIFKKGLFITLSQREELKSLMEEVVTKRGIKDSGCCFCGGRESEDDPLLGPVLLSGSSSSGKNQIAMFHFNCAYFTPDVYVADSTDLKKDGDGEKKEYTKLILYKSSHPASIVNNFFRAAMIASTNFLLFGFEPALKRSKQIKCSKCQKKGASIGCWNSSCMRSYHYPCIVALKLSFGKQGDSRSFLCPEHSKSQNKKGQKKSGK